jgi:hypothetical protein
VTDELVAVALEKGSIFTKMRKLVCCQGIEVKFLSSAQGGAAAVTARSARPRVADSGLLREEIVAFSVHLPREPSGALEDGGGGDA